MATKRPQASWQSINKWLTLTLLIASSLLSGTEGLSAQPIAIDSSPRETTRNGKSTSTDTQTPEGSTRAISRFPNDPLLGLLNVADKEVINHFGIEAPSMLLDYIDGLCGILLNTHVQARCDPREIDSLQPLDRKQLETSKYYATISQATREVVDTFGEKSFSWLNSYAINLEDLLLKARESGYKGLRVSDPLTAYLLSQVIQKSKVQQNEPTDVLAEAESGLEDIRNRIREGKASEAMRLIDNFINNFSNNYHWSQPVLEAVRLLASLGEYSKSNKIAASIYKSQNTKEGDAPSVDKLNAIQLFAVTSFYARDISRFADLIHEAAEVQHDLESKWIQGVPLGRGGKLLTTTNISRIMESAASSVDDQDVNRSRLFSIINQKGLTQEIDAGQTKLAREIPKAENLAAEINGYVNQASRFDLDATTKRKLGEAILSQRARLLQLIPPYMPKAIETAEAQAALPKNSFLVEFYKYEKIDGVNMPAENERDFHYAALILDRHGAVRNIQIGKARDIDRLINIMIRSMSEGLSDSDQYRKIAYQKLIAPLMPLLQSSKETFIVLDGELNKVPANALFILSGNNSDDTHGPPKARLLTSARDLIASSNLRGVRGKALVIVDPSFSRRPTGKMAARYIQANSRFSDHQKSLTAREIHWDSLPGTRQEGEQVSAIINGRLLTGRDATTRSVSNAINPIVLHIASHGFFAGEANQGDNSITRLGEALFRADTNNPLLLSGIVLAGANQPDADPNDDGYLTAAEATGLNLDGTELVVLSACSTAQGEIRTGEGVYGLQRALTVAGARSTLLSLWKVDDAATAEFMTRFYRRLKAGEGRADALAAVQKEFRDGKTGNELWREPAYWAAWQLVGDWRPIQGL